MGKPKQTAFDIACDVFYEHCQENETEFDKKVADEVITPALKEFRDELRNQMGNDEFYIDHEKIKND